MRVRDRSPYGNRTLNTIPVLRIVGEPEGERTNRRLCRPVVVHDLAVDIRFPDLLDQ